MHRLASAFLLALFAVTAFPLQTQAWQAPTGQTGLFNLENVFDLEYVGDPRISPSGDGPSFFYRWWFPGYPWEHRDHYMDRSPISLAGNVTTPTMLLTGEEDYRTPISETEQYYTALKLQGVETVMVRIPGSGHSIASRPSQLMTKVAHILTWFEEH